MTEYILQKRTLKHWSYVTWYDDLEQAKRNFLAASKEGNGYSWRLVEVTVIDEKMLSDDSQPESEGEEATAEVTDKLKPSWGVPSTDWGNNLSNNSPAASEHGSKGSVWLGNPTTKEKKRVPAAEAAIMMAEGWVKTGPRTTL